MIERKFDLISAQLDEMKFLMKRQNTAYDKLCIPGHHYWAQHNREPVKNEQKCLCGGQNYKEALG